MAGAKTPDPLEFESRLFASMDEFRKLNVRGVWLRLPPALADFIPPAVRAGFSFHSARPEAVTLTAVRARPAPLGLTREQWLPHEEENKLPPGAYHFIGVGAFVLNSKDEILVVRENSGPSSKLAMEFWKLPGGLVDRQEDFHSASERELLEETGIRASFKCISTIQEVHHTEARGGYARGGTTDLYAICVLKLEDEDQKIVPQEAEIAEAKWMPAQQVLSLPYYANRSTMLAHVFHHAYAVATGKAVGMATDRMQMSERYAGALMNVYYAKL